MLNGAYSFHHIGLACRNAKREADALALLGYVRAGAPFEDRGLGMAGEFWELPQAPHSARMEIVTALPGSTVLESWLAQGVKMYHAAYLHADLRAALDDLQKARGKILVPPTPAVGFQMRPVAFVMLPNLMLVEVIQS